tara:strand:+ start:1528 stop:2763 length:1236 start_codon:yes stop_codon:yes gene_type:complete
LPTTLNFSGKNILLFSQNIATLYLYVDHRAVVVALTRNPYAEALPSLSAILAQTVGSAANWATSFPPYEVASTAFDKLPSELQTYIVERAANHGIDAVELFRKIPEKLWVHPQVMEDWLLLMDISHIKPQASHPQLADNPSNVIWEPLGDNRSRGNAEMSGEEFKEALDNGVDTGRQLIDEINNNNPVWIELRELFHAFVQCAELIGYSVTWVPKELFGEFMNNILSMLKKLRAANGWTQKVRIAKAWVTHDISRWVNVHGHPVAACFMLAVLTLEMPALAFLVTTWACTGLLGLAIHVLKFILTKTDGAGSYKGRRLEWVVTLKRHFNMGLNRLEIWIQRIHNILNSIKNGLFSAATKIVDLIVDVSQHIWKTIVQPSAQKIIEQARNVFTGFLRWIDESLRTLVDVAVA